MTTKRMILCCIVLVLSSVAWAGIEPCDPNSGAYCKCTQFSIVNWWFPSTPGVSDYGYVDHNVGDHVLLPSAALSGNCKYVAEKLLSNGWWSCQSNSDSTGQWITAETGTVAKNGKLMQHCVPINNGYGSTLVTLRGGNQFNNYNGGGDIYGVGGVTITKFNNYVCDASNSPYAAWNGTLGALNSPGPNAPVDQLLLNTVSWDCPYETAQYGTPLVVFSGAFKDKFSDWEHGVMFKLGPNEDKVKLGWPLKDSEVGFIVLPSEDGSVTNLSTNMFGNFSPQSWDKSMNDKLGGIYPDPFTGNGINALRLYDFNKDGVIDERDAIYFKLRVWYDDHTGKYPGGRVLTLKEAGIHAIYLDNYLPSDETDGKGNSINWEGKMRSDDPNLRIVDYTPAVKP